MEEAAEVQKISASEGEEKAYRWTADFPLFVAPVILETGRALAEWFRFSDSIEFTLSLLQPLLGISVILLLIKLYVSLWKVKFTEEGIEWFVWTKFGKVRWSEVTRLEESPKHGLSLKVQTLSKDFSVPIYGMKNLDELKKEIKSKQIGTITSPDLPITLKFRLEPVWYVLVLCPLIFFGVSKVFKIPDEVLLPYLHVGLLLPIVCFFPLVPALQSKTVVTNAEIVQYKPWFWRKDISFNEPFKWKITENELTITEIKPRKIGQKEITLHRAHYGFEEIVHLLELKSPTLPKPEGILDVDSRQELV